MSGPSPWPAMVLTAGLGTRIQPLSLLRAKPAIPLAGEPIVRRVLAWLARHGVRDVVLNLHHRPRSIRSAVGDGADLGLRVRYSCEDPILGSAGGPRQALALLDAERFFLVNGDTLTDLDLGALARTHEQSGASVTMAVVANPAPAHYGGVLLGNGGAVHAFAPAAGADPKAWLFIGVQAVDASVFAGLAPGEPAETVRSLYPALIRAEPGAVRGFVATCSFLDIGTPGDYLAASLALAAREGRRDAPSGRGCTVSASARLVRTALWDDVAVADGAELVDCIVTDGVHVPTGARFRSSILARADALTPGEGMRVVGDLLVAPFDPRPGGRLAGAPR